jgi:hypothetical protein
MPEPDNAAGSSVPGPFPEASPPKSKFAAILLLIGKITGLLVAFTGLVVAATNPEVLKFVQAYWTPHEQAKEINLVDDRQVEKGLIGTWEGYIADNQGKCTYSWLFKVGYCECKADYFNIQENSHRIAHTSSGWHVGNQIVYIDPPAQSLPGDEAYGLAQPGTLLSRWTPPQPWVFAVGIKQVVSLASDRLVLKVPFTAALQRFTMTRKQ